MNPALALAKVAWILADQGSCDGTRNFWVFLIAPLVGAVLASAYRTYLSENMILNAKLSQELLNGHATQYQKLQSPRTETEKNGHDLSA